MKIISDFNNEIKGEYAVALGIFDGLHIAHTAVIKNVVLTAGNLIPAVFIFSENFKGTNNLLTESMLLKYLENIGVEVIFKASFKEMCNLLPKEFAENILLKSLTQGR